MLTLVRHIGVYYMFGLLDCVRYNEDFVISRFVILRFVISRFCPIHFTVTLAVAVEYGSLCRGLRYIEVRQIQVLLFATIILPSNLEKLKCRNYRFL